MDIDVFMHGIDWQLYLQKALAWTLSSGVRVLVTIVLGLVALRIVRLLSRKLFESLGGRHADVEAKKRTKTLGGVVRHILSVLVLIVVAMMVLKELGIEIAPILAAAGIVGLAVGFGAQNLVKDIISGFFILLDDQIRVNDVVEVAGKGGVVEKVNLRMTVLRDLAGNVHYVRNGHIDVITNMTKKYSRYVFEVGVAYREDVDRVIEALKEVDNELRADPDFSKDILEPLEVLGLDQFADSAVIIKARTKTRPIKQWRVGREFNRRMKKKFDGLGIEIPFPHVTLYMGSDKEGNSPPLNVRVTDSGK